MWLNFSSLLCCEKIFEKEREREREAGENKTEMRRDEGRPAPVPKSSAEIIGESAAECSTGAHSRRLIEAFERGNKFISETTIGGVTRRRARWESRGESFTYESFLMHGTLWRSRPPQQPQPLRAE